MCLWVFFWFGFFFFLLKTSNILHICDSGTVCVAPANHLPIMTG